jgi:Fe-S-cluster containining protein
MCRFVRAVETLERDGMYERIAAVQSTTHSTEESRKAAQQYFDLHIDCPFLEDELCSIYPQRPSRCREYLVTSPSQHCANPFEHKISRLPVSVRLSEAFSRAWAALTGSRPILIPLVCAMEWVAANEEARYCAVDNPGSVIEAIAGFISRPQSPW